MFVPSIQQIETKNLSWINVNRIGPEEMKYLEENYKFHPLHLADCLSPIQRPKLDIATDYLFMVLLFPIYNHRSRELIPSEVDFFISSNYLVTVHNNELSPLINFFNLCQISKSQQKKYFVSNPSFLLYELLYRLLVYCNPIVDNLNLNVRHIEENIFRGFERRMVREILIVKRNIVNFRRIIQVHRTVINKLVNKSQPFFSAGQLKLYFDNLIEMIDEIWDNLENLRQTIEAIERTNNSLISFKLNDVIKVLTIISVTMLPVTLIASIFGMNIESMPLINRSGGFWLILILMAIVSGYLFFYFKKKQWL